MNIYDSLTTEQKLLIILSKVNPQSDDLFFLDNVESGSVDWQYILDCSTNHRISHLVYSNILKFIDKKVTTDVLESFKKISIENTRKALLLTSSLIKIANDLNGLGITAMALKGPLLSQLLYGNTSARDYSDLDLLIRKEDLNTVKEYLYKNGFKQQFDLTQSQDDYYLNSGYYYFNFISVEKSIIVDLHWSTHSPNYSFSRGLDYFICNQQTVEINKFKFNTLRPEDVLMELCIHTAKHNYSSLIWLSDIANTLSIFPAMDYDYVKTEAEKRNCSRMLRFTFSFINDLYKMNLPQHLIDCDKSMNQEKLKEIVVRTLFKNNQSKDQSILPLFVKLMDSFGDQIKYFLNNYFYPTPMEFSLCRFGDKWFFLYYPLRIMRLIGKVLGNYKK